MSFSPKANKCTTRCVLISHFPADGGESKLMHALNFHSRVPYPLSDSVKGIN